MKLKYFLILVFITSGNYLTAQNMRSLQEKAFEDFDNLKGFIGSDDVTIYEFRLVYTEDNEIFIKYSVGREIPYPGTNDFNIAYNKGELIFANVVKVKKKGKKIVLNFNSNGYNGISSYMGSPWKPFTKYVISIEVRNKAKRKELIEVFKTLAKNPIIKDLK